MHIVIALLGILGAGYFWYLRTRDAAKVAKKVAEIPNDLRLAARRFGFKRRSNTHPVDNVEDQDLAIAGIASAFVTLGDMPSTDDYNRLMRYLGSELGVTPDKAEELLVLGRWLVNECGLPAEGVRRLSRRASKLFGAAPIEDLLGIVQKTLNDNWNADQLDALETVKRAFHI